MKKSRLFFCVVFAMFLGVSLLPTAVLSQPALPENEFSDVPNNGILTDAFTIEVRASQYWQGRPFILKITKERDVELENSVLLSVKPDGSSWDEIQWVGFDYNDGQSINHSTGVFDTHVEYINSLSVGESFQIAVFPGSPRGPLRFYQPKDQDVRLGFYYKEDEKDLEPTLFVSNSDRFKVLSESLTYENAREDAIFFEGETISFKLSDLPMGYGVSDSSMLMFNHSNTPSDLVQYTYFEFVRVHFVICNQDGCEIGPIFENQENEYLEFENVELGEIVIEGVVNPELGQVNLGFVIELTTEGTNFNDPLKAWYDDDYHVLGLFEDDSIGSKMFTMCPNQVLECDMPLPIIANFGLIAVDGIILPDLSEQTNLYNTDKPLPIKKENVGTIAFDPGLNLVDNTSQLALLNEAFNLEKDVTNNKLIASFDTAAISFLSGVGATIIFENAMEILGFENVDAETFLEYVDIKVYDGDTIIEDISEYVDFDNSSYNPETDELSLRVYHFTEYVVSAAEEDEVITPPVEDDDESVEPIDDEDQTTPPGDEEKTLIPDTSDPGHWGWFILPIGFVILIVSFLFAKGKKKD